MHGFTFRYFAYSVLKLGWNPCFMLILERVRLMSQDRACPPRAGMLNGSLQHHSLEDALQEGRQVSNIYVTCRAKVSTANGQRVVKADIQRFLCEVLLGMWVEFPRLTPINIRHVSGVLLSSIRTPERENISHFKVSQWQQLLLSQGYDSEHSLNTRNLLWCMRANWNALLWLLPASYRKISEPCRWRRFCSNSSK